MRYTENGDRDQDSNSPHAVCAKIPSQRMLKSHIKRVKRRQLELFMTGVSAQSLEHDRALAMFAAALPTLAFRIGYDTSARDLYDIYVPDVATDSSLRRSIGWSVRLNWSIGHMFYTSERTTLREKKEARTQKLTADIQALSERSYRAIIFCRAMIDEPKTSIWYQYLADVYAIVDMLSTL